VDADNVKWGSAWSLGRDQSGTLARFRSAKESSESTSSKIAQMRRAGRVRKGLLLGVDRTYGDHHETDVGLAPKDIEERLSVVPGRTVERRFF